MHENDARFCGLRTRIVLVFIGIGVLLVATDSGLAWAGSECITLDVDSPMRLPNGAVHPAGQLTLCDTWGVTPVSRIHKTFIDGHPVAMLSSRTTRSEGGDKIDPVVMFSREADGRLALIGYVIPGNHGSITYLLDDSKKPVRRRSRNADEAVTASSDRQETEQGTEDTFITVAARTPR